MISFSTFRGAVVYSVIMLSSLSLNALSIADEIIELLQHGETHAYIGEEVTQLEHALQAAYFAREGKPDDDEFVIAALLHDVGHLLPGEKMGELGVQDHESVGAQWLKARGASERFITLVKEHVNAKRYLMAVDAVYAEKLSGASKGTLEYQGGPMSAEEAELFGSSPLLDDILLMRRCDERAKCVGLDVPDLAAYEALLRAYFS